MKLACDCCEGPNVLTPMPTANRPGLSWLRYRVGTYATFFETMQARLAGDALPELAALRTREPSDPSMALLDAWAIVGDVLTFYQERIANEGYLRTAVERRSVLELARLIGTRLPGVASSVFWRIQSRRIRRRSRSWRARGPTAFPRRASRCRRSRPPIRSSRATNGTAPLRPPPAAAAAIVSNGLHLKAPRPSSPRTILC
jgi:hypothetical protein